MRVFTEYPTGWTGQAIPEKPVPLVDDRGIRQPRLVITPFNYNGRSAGSGWTPVQMVADSGATDGFAIRVTAGSIDGFVMDFTVGNHFMIGDKIRLTIRSRTSLPLTHGTVQAHLSAPGIIPLALTLHRDGDEAIAYSAKSGTLDLAGAATGVTLRLDLYGDAPSADCFIDSIALEVVDAPIAELSGTATAAEMATAINALIAAARRGVPIA